MEGLAQEIVTACREDIGALLLETGAALVWACKVRSTDPRPRSARTVRPAFELRAIYDVARDTAGRYADLFNTSKELTVGGTLSIDKLKLYAAFERLSAPDAPTGHSGQT
jgi:hypothetical protein